MTEQQEPSNYRMPYPDRWVPYLAVLGGIAGAGTFLYLGPSWLWPFGFIGGLALFPTLIGFMLGGPTDAE